MKHRSVIAFILLAAALFAAPQIANDLSAMRSAFGARIRGEILRAVLNLKAEDGASDLVVRHADPLLASLETNGKACTQAQPAAKKRDARAQMSPRTEASGQEVFGNQFAMLIDPTSVKEIALADLSNAEKQSAFRQAAALTQSEIAHGEVAMISTPDASGTLTSLASALTNAPNEKDSARRLQKHSEAQVRIAYIAAEFEKLGAPEMSEEMFRRINTTLNDAKASRPSNGDVRSKVFKFRRTNNNVNNKTWSAPLHLKVMMPHVSVAALAPPGLVPDSAGSGE